MADWHKKLDYSQKLSDEAIKELLNPKNPRLELMAKFLP
jgi:hypothetical protein